VTVSKLLETKLPMRINSDVRKTYAVSLLAACVASMIVLFSFSCQKRPAPTSQPVTNQTATNTPPTETSPVEVRSFHGTGIVTKVVRENPYDKSLASVELNHGEIVGLMPAMLMEFYVKHVSLLDGLKVGDVVDFTIEEKGSSEIISEIKKK
jgi:Cu/Ag efflux protein CusF